MNKYNIDNGKKYNTKMNMEINPSEYKILIVDDVMSNVLLLKVLLTNEKFAIATANNGQQALEQVEKEHPDLVLLDVMMPDMDGIAMCRRIRETNNIPIIMVSAKTQDIDKIVGLSTGADDYVAKPFNPLELMARVKSQIRRYVRLGSIESKEGVIITGGLALDTVAKELTLDGEPVRLTAREYGIVEYLMRNLGHVLSTQQIYEAVWNEPSYSSEKTVTVHIRRIREKIEINPKEPKYLKVVWGIGYKIEKLS